MSSLAAKFAQIFSAVNNGDAAPTVDAMQAFRFAQSDLDSVTKKWSAVRAKDLPAINVQLKQAGLAPIAIDAHKPLSRN